MIFADKLIDLRKKNGLSQEQLAEKLNVSRQSVSKWESAQSVPDLNKVLQLSELFGVTTDYLLKDDLESSVPAEDVWTPENESAAVPVRHVSMEEAVSFLDISRTASEKISLGVMLCILSPIPMILLAVSGGAGLLPITEDQGGILGLLLLFPVIAAAVTLFIIHGGRLGKYGYLETEVIETAYGVSGMVRERRDEYADTHTRRIVTGVVLCILSAIPMFAAGMLRKENDVIAAAGAAVTLIIVSFGVRMLVKTGIIQGGYQKLLEEQDYSRARKRREAQSEPVRTIYWSVVLTIYLGYSFITFDWGRSWIIWPVAAVLYGAVAAIAGVVRKDRPE